jgi:hypothetical protein
MLKEVFFSFDCKTLHSPEQGDGATAVFSVDRIGYRIAEQDRRFRKVGTQIRLKPISTKGENSDEENDLARNGSSTRVSCFSHVGQGG